MPLTQKGKKIRNAMRDEYHSEKRGDEVFYGAINKGTIKGTEHKKSHRKGAKRGR